MVSINQLVLIWINQRQPSFRRKNYNNNEVPISSDFVFSTQGDNQQHVKKPPDISLSSTSTTSFRDKLIVSNQNSQIQEKEDMIAKKLVRIEHEHGNRLLPKVFLENEVFEDMCTPWKDALVIKLLGKTLGYNTLKDRLKKVWKVQGGFEIMDNDNGFCMVKFDKATDGEKVISDGPWMTII